jgi:hypothetical protein
VEGVSEHHRRFGEVPLPPAVTFADAIWRGIKLDDQIVNHDSHTMRNFSR